MDIRNILHRSRADAGRRRGPGWRVALLLSSVAAGTLGAGPVLAQDQAAGAEPEQAIEDEGKLPLKPLVVSEIGRAHV